MHVVTVIVVVFVVTVCTPGVRGGICWLSTGKNGLCRQIYNINLTKDQCCSMGIPTVSWTPHRSVSGADLMYWAAFKGGAPNCKVCHSTCKNVKCDPDRKCKVRRGQARCVCSPRCPRYLKLQGPVCGTDRSTYRNYCTMLRHNCRRGTETRLSYFGQCIDSCKQVKCFNPRHKCLEDQNGLPHCVVCNTDCSKQVYPQDICGEDGVTYPSYCHLVAAICMKGKAIRKAYVGPCKLFANCDTVQCPAGYACLVDKTSGLPQCAYCQVSCPTPAQVNATYVCGSDGLTYPSYCKMQQIACQSGTVIKTAHNGRCREMNLVKSSSPRRLPQTSRSNST